MTPIISRYTCPLGWRAEVYDSPLLLQAAIDDEAWRKRNLRCRTWRRESSRTRSVATPLIRIDRPSCCSARRRGGLRRTASWITLFTALSFGIIGFLPGVQDRFLDNQGSGSALLLAAPAIVITFLNRSGENSIASTLLAPLRSFVWLCVAAFSLAAAVVVTKPEDPFMSWFWSSGAIIAAGLGGFLLVGYIVSSTRDTR